MTLEHRAFTPYRDEEEREKDKSKVYPVRLNLLEQERLKEAKALLRQPKDSTALKMLADIGYNVLQDRLTNSILDVVFKNKDKNERLGIREIE